MCGRYGQINTDAEKIKKRFRLKKIKMELVPRYNIAPTQDVPCVLNVRPDELRPVRWGLVPFWAKDVTIGSRMINARAETVCEKPAYRKPIKSQRCLIPADCFYEWKKEEGGKQPYCIRRKDGETMAFAGIWDAWQKDGNDLHTCSIITCAPNKLMEGIHQRMPVILNGEEERAWLEDIDIPGIQKLLKPCDDTLLEAFPISKAVNSPANDSPDLLKALN